MNLRLLSEGGEGLEEAVAGFKCARGAAGNSRTTGSRRVDKQGDNFLVGTPVTSALTPQYQEVRLVRFSLYELCRHCVHAEARLSKQKLSST